MDKLIKRISAKHKPLRHYFDRFAADIAKSIAYGDPLDAFEPKEVAAILRVSTGWLDAGRVNGYGPPFVKLSPALTRYLRWQLVEYLLSRTPTPEFGKVMISTNRGHHGRAVKKQVQPSPTSKT